jgi:hypothetical protein
MTCPLGQVPALASKRIVERVILVTNERKKDKKNNQDMVVEFLAAQTGKRVFSVV